MFSKMYEHIYECINYSIKICHVRFYYLDPEVMYVHILSGFVMLDKRLSIYQFFEFS